MAGFVVIMFGRGLTSLTDFNKPKPALLPVYTPPAPVVMPRYTPHVYFPPAQTPPIARPPEAPDVDSRLRDDSPPLPEAPSQPETPLDPHSRSHRSLRTDYRLRSTVPNTDRYQYSPTPIRVHQYRALSSDIDQ